MYKYIDISTWQKNVDYAKVKADGVVGVILRVGYTGSANKSLAKDELFEKHYAGFKSVGIPMGVYWYSRAVTPSEALKEAEKTLQLIEGKEIKLPIYIDIEDPAYQAKASKEAITSVARAYCERIKASGYIAGIYASTSWLNNKLNMASLENDFEVWVAQYNTVCTYKRKYQMWQYTSSAYVDGISKYAYVDTQSADGLWFKKKVVINPVDVNHCYKRYHDVEASVEQPKPLKKYLKLSRLVPSWRVYPLDKPAVSGNEVGKLAPMRFGGLTYEILEELPNSVYVINTATFGKVKIWAGKGTLHSIEVK